MACAVDESVTQDSPRGVAEEKARGYETRYDRLDMRCCQTDADQRPDVTIGKLDQADAQDERPYCGENGGHVVFPTVPPLRGRYSAARADRLDTWEVHAAVSKI